MANRSYAHTLISVSAGTTATRGVFTNFKGTISGTVYTDSDSIIVDKTLPTLTTPVMISANIYNGYFNGTFTLASSVADDAAGISGATCCMGVGTETLAACVAASTYYTSGGYEYCGRTNVTYP